MSNIQTINNFNETISDDANNIPSDMVDFASNSNENIIELTGVSDKDSTETNTLDIENANYYYPNYMLNLSFQNDRFNDIMDRPSTSTHSFVKEIRDLNSSSFVFKLTSAIFLKIQSIIYSKGKQPEYYPNLEIEQLVKNSSLDTLVYELSDTVLESDTMNNLLYLTNIFMYVNSSLKNIAKVDSLLKKNDLGFPLDVNSAFKLLKDLNSDPANPEIYILRNKLCIFIALQKSILRIHREDTSVLVRFYSSYLKNLFVNIDKTLQVLKFENLINNSFSTSFSKLPVASNSKKRTIDHLQDIPVEKNSKMYKKSPSL